MKKVGSKMGVRYCTDSDGVANYIVNNFGDNGQTILNHYEIEVLRLIEEDVFLSEEEIKSRIKLSDNLRTYVENLERLEFITNIADGKSYVITPNGKIVLELLKND